MLCVMMLPLVVVGCTSKAVCQSCEVATTLPSGVDNAALPTGRHRRTGLFSPARERLTTMQTTGRNPEVILMSRRSVCITGTHAIIVSTCALPAEYKCLKY